MTKLTLNRQKANNPDFAELESMIKSLHEILREPVSPENQTWRSSLNEIIHFRHPTLGFSLLDTYQVGSEARVEFCCMPNYLCAAVLMKTVTTDEALFTEFSEPLRDALKHCAKIGFFGHGSEARVSMAKEMLIFTDGHVAEFLKETIDTFNTSDTRGNSPSYGTNYQKLGKELMSRDELAVMNGSKCVLQLRGVRPFLSDKYDITQHPNYKYTSDYDKKYTFDIEKYLNRRMKLKAEDEYDVIEA